MRRRILIGIALASAVVFSVIVFLRCRANAEPLSDTIAQADGLKVAAVRLTERDWTASLFDGAIFRFRFESPGADKLVNVYVERFHKGKKVGTIGGLGVMPTNANADLTMDCSIAFVPMGKNLYEADNLKVTTMILHNSSSLILPNPLKGLPTVTFGSAEYDGKGSWKTFAAGQPGSVSSTMMDDETIMVRFEAIRPKMRSSGTPAAH